MTPYRAIQGLDRSWFLLALKMRVLLHFLPLALPGWRRRDELGALPRLSPRRFFLFIRRLLLFLDKLDHNKFIRLAGRARLDLYVPAFPSPAFYHGCTKFLQFDELPPCVTVLISVTSACRFACEHCYQRLDQGRDVPLDRLLDVVRKLQQQGVAFFNVEGGEPFLVYDRLRAVCEAIDHRSEVWVNSTGDGMTVERLGELRRRNLSAVMFSLHAADPGRLNEFMRSPKAWETLARGVEACHAAGVPVAFNTCLPREAYHNGEFERIMNAARDLGGCLVQLIQPKPAGGWLASGAPEFQGPDYQRLEELVRRYNHHPDYRDYPAIAAQALIEDGSRFGCTAGGVDRFYINAKGDVQPCEFLNLSFGNILQEDFSAIFTRMRRSFDPPGQNWLCEACAPALREAYVARNRPPLPLPPEALASLDLPRQRGAPTNFYARLRALK